MEDLKGINVEIRSKSITGGIVKIVDKLRRK
jgi:hypothetical protein